MAAVSSSKSGNNYRGPEDRIPPQESWKYTEKPYQETSSLPHPQRPSNTSRPDHGHSNDSSRDQESYSLGPTNLESPQAAYASGRPPRTRRYISDEASNPENPITSRTNNGEGGRRTEQPKAKIQRMNTEGSQGQENNVMANGRRNKSSEKEVYSDDDPDNSRWIHRDKLALIEIQEMQAAGIPITHQGMVRARAALNGNEVDYRPLKDITQSGQNGQLEQDSPAVSDEGEEHEMQNSSWQAGNMDDGDNRPTDPEPMNHDLRTPEEIAADPYESHAHPIYQHGLRSSSSRIPLSKTSPLPVPQEHIERSTPLTRKRGASGNWGELNEDGLRYNKLRNRSYSQGSQVLLDDTEAMGSPPQPNRPQSPPQGYQTSPSKPRAPSKGETSPGQRKGSVPGMNTSGTPKTRTTSGGANNKRPPTRSGSEGRPHTAINRPEGDPPWLATMYKPDPRLPPEQQLIPTHAKRLQQEQWERERKASEWKSSPTKKPLDDIQPPPPANDPAGTSPQLRTTENPLWPPPKANGAGSIRSFTGEHAGYSTVPKVQSTPPIGALPSPRLPQPMKVHEPIQQPVEKEKGCGCCIVM
ncbi:MAG: hypothetical protein MMC33_007618 [Icmadophila ericetorum]|nr:hypothetical protein [Icmadophila ericetorum]